MAMLAPNGIREAGGRSGHDPEKLHCELAAQAPLHQAQFELAWQAAQLDPYAMQVALWHDTGQLGNTAADAATQPPAAGHQEQTDSAAHWLHDDATPQPTNERTRHEKKQQKQQQAGVLCGFTLSWKLVGDRMYTPMYNVLDAAAAVTLSWEKVVLVSATVYELCVGTAPVLRSKLEIATATRLNTRTHPM
jgi:hypothetical protein